MAELELARGEGPESVYLFVLRLHTAGKELGITIKVIGYDNACKLLAYARMMQNECLPWSSTLVEALDEQNID